MIGHEPLHILPFDHRGAFQTKMFGWTGTLSPSQTAEIASTKQVIYDGFRSALQAGVLKEKAELEEILPDLDLVLVMTVNPRFGHQHFIHSTLPKIQWVPQIIERMKLNCDVEVDGGIDEQTRPLAEAGADVVVARPSIFGNKAGVASAMASRTPALLITPESYA